VRIPVNFRCPGFWCFGFGGGLGWVGGCLCVEWGGGFVGVLGWRGFGGVGLVWGGLGWRGFCCEGGGVIIGCFVMFIICGCSGGRGVVGAGGWSCWFAERPGKGSHGRPQNGGVGSARGRYPWRGLGTNPGGKVEQPDGNKASREHCQHRGAGIPGRGTDGPCSRGARSKATRANHGDEEAEPGCLLESSKTNTHGAKVPGQA